MEDALDGIFDEDVPPSVTAVAASVTQLYQLIIGCDNTRIFMDDKGNRVFCSLTKMLFRNQLGRWMGLSIRDITFESNVHDITARTSVRLSQFSKLRTPIYMCLHYKKTLRARCVSCASRTTHHTLVLNEPLHMVMGCS